MNKWFLGGLLALLLVGCPTLFTVSSSAGTGGSISPTTQQVNRGATTSVTVTPNAGFSISSVTGCDGTLTGNTYTTAAINANCSINATFSPIPTVQFTVNATAGTGGTVSPPTQQVNSGSTTTVTVTPNAGYVISSVTGCNGALAGNTYTTAAISANCGVSANFAIGAPTNGSTDFAVTGLGLLQASRTSNYRVSALPAPAAGRPLVIFLHGNGSNNTQVPTTYASLTDAFAAVLVAPQGLNADWRFRLDGKNNAGTAAEVDDVAFIDELITRATNTANPLFGAGNKIDSSKVYIIGESRGAGMAYYLYADQRTKDKINAIAPISGTFFCATSNSGNGTTPYTPPADSDLNCGQNGGFGYFAPKPTLYVRTNAPRIFDIHGTVASGEFSSTQPPALDNEFGNLILMTKQWAQTSDGCGALLPSANPVFTGASINGLTVNGYRQRNQANTAPCAADVTFFIAQNGGHVPSGFAERIVKWFFGQYNTQTNTFTP